MSGAKTVGSSLCEELKANSNINHDSVEGTVLATILNKKVPCLTALKNELPLEQIKGVVNKDNRSLYHSLKAGKTRFILECKKASPSKGLIRADFDVAQIAQVYDNYAAAISVLCDKDFFQGDYKYLAKVKAVTHVPVLCKDFIIDPYQVYLASYYGADAILLMLSVLTDEAYKKLSTLAHSLGLEVLTEASTEHEVKRAINLNLKLVGINNRNLRTLEVDLNNVKKLSALLPKDCVVISESGIYTHTEVLSLSKYAKGFLVGSSLTAKANIDLACRELIYGLNKVCGITNPQDAIFSYQAGAVYNGLIFAAKSKRYITPEMAHQIVSCARAAYCQQGFVGVFVNEDIAKIVDIALTAPLDVIQLHGNENEAYITNLRNLLPSHIKIWKAIGVSENCYPQNEITEFLKVVDMIVLDAKLGNECGGLGVCFNWELITDDYHKIILAGGLTPELISKAQSIAPTIGMDLNSGLENASGIKDHELITRAFMQLKNY